MGLLQEKDDSDLRIEAWKALEEAQLRGYLTKGHPAASKLQTRLTFFRFGAQVASASETTTASQALHAWTDHLVRVGACNVSQALRARQQFEAKNSAACSSSTSDGDTEKQKETLALEELSKIFPKASVTIQKVCTDLIGCIRACRSDLAVRFLRKYLQRDQGSHVCTVADDKSGQIMWAICIGLMNASDPGNGPTETFITLLNVLIDEYNVSVDQRSRSDSEDQSRNPLQYVAKSGRPKAVRAMLHRGAKVNLRDDEGWTALHAICMNDVAAHHEGGPTTQDRVETARLLVDAGAELEAGRYNDFTPFLSLMCQPNPELMRFLLSRGANPRHRSSNGWGAVFLIEEADGKIDPEVLNTCRKMLEDSIASSEQAMSVLNEQQRMMKFKKLLKDVLVPAHNEFILSRAPRETDHGDEIQLRADQERKVLETLLLYLHLDTTVVTRLFQPGDGNWLEQLHSRLAEIIPAVFQKIYLEDTPTEHEWGLMMAIEENALKYGERDDGSPGSPRRFDQEVAKRAVLRQYRERGLIYRGVIMEHFSIMVVDPAQHSVSYAVPNKLLLDKIALYGPVVEAGAGTGYWTAVIESTGVDIVAYDKSPPECGGNGFFDHTYTKVRQGDGADPNFWTQGDLSSRALLLVWPNNPDKVDNPHLYNGDEDIQPVWDVDCLAGYMKNGGRTVIYVGEREDTIRVMPNCRPDCGVSSSRRFQRMLKALRFGGRDYDSNLVLIHGRCYNLAAQMTITTPILLLVEELLRGFVLDTSTNRR